MKISTQLIKFINGHYHSAGDPAPDGVENLVRTIGAQLGAVEEVIPFGERFKDVLIVRVVSCENHPDADRLHVCKVDDGGTVEHVERDGDGLVQVVCGAPNVRAGMFAAWLPPGATVPGTYGSDDPFVLEARPLRGVVSNGMMASPKELTIGDSHEGILEIDAGFSGVVPGARFADVYHLEGDVVIDMENKMFTHRPDCFGWLGIARELEGIQHRPYKSPAWYAQDVPFPAIESEPLPLTVTNELPELVPRFVAVALRDVAVKPSPVWLQVDLARVGLRPINNIVDYTNFFMLETGQPLHAYDYDKVKALSGGKVPAITVRHPRQGERLMLLSGKEIEPRDEAIMIATDKRLIGVGGVMGGADTEVDEHTRNIIIECANFDMYSVRRTAMAHGLFTDAVTRFNKGQSPLQNKAVAAKIVDEIRRFASGKVAGPLIDINHMPADVMERGNLHPPVKVTASFINERLGWELSAEEMSTLLGNVEFKVAIIGDELTIAAPFWRTDIESPEDVVEEVGRLYGYDHLPMVLPVRDLTPAAKNPSLELKASIRDILAGAGANEVLTYSFVHGNVLDRAGQPRDKAFQLSNALSPDLQYYRMSLMPSLLEHLHPNLKAGYDHFALFELNKVHSTLHEDEEGLPVESSVAALAVTAGDKAADKAGGAAFYEARTYLDYLAVRLGLRLEYAPISEAPDDPLMQPYDHMRSAYVHLRGGERIGIIGEYKPGVLRSLKLPKYTAGFEIGLEQLVQAANGAPQYVALPRFPKVTQDVTVRVPASVAYSELERFFSAFMHDYKEAAYSTTVTGTDIYQGSDLQHKHITFRITAASYERTLTDDEVNRMLDEAVSAAKGEFDIVRV